MSGPAPSPKLGQALAAAEARYRARHPESARLHERACRHLPGGSTRSAIHYTPFPLAFRGGAGNRITDVDGLEYVDLLGEYSAGLYGHSDPRLQLALRRVIDDGWVLGGPNPYEARLAEAICRRFPSIELVRFTNSGTEANLVALSGVRARSPARRGVLVFEGAYHGGVFNFRHGHDGLNLDLDFCRGVYNDIESTRRLLRDRARTLCAVLVEPMQGGGCVPATPEFLRMLREECSAHDLVLIFDEVMTSRLSPGGMQGRLGLAPDLTTLGKYLGGGASFGAFGGRTELMQRFDLTRPDAFQHAGTFNNNVFSMAAGLAGLTEVYTLEAAARLDAQGEALCDRLIAAAAAAGHARGVTVTGVGSFIGIHLAPRLEAQAARRDRRPGDGQPGEGRAGEAEAGAAALAALFHLDMIERGFYLGRRGYIALSLPTAPADCERFAAAFEQFLGEQGPLIA